MTLTYITLLNTPKLDIPTLENLWKWIFPSLISLGEKIIIAAIAYFVGVWLINILRKIVDRLLVRKRVDGAVSTFINSLINMSLKILLVIVIIGILGIPTTSFAAILAAAGLAIGLAMKDNLSNFAGGVMILINKPFKLKDSIEVQGQTGTVHEIGILYTVLITADGKTIYIPNGPLSTGSIINYSTQLNRRVDITLNINYGNDANGLRNVIADIIDSNDKILKTPAPFIGVTAIKNGNYDITIRAWGKNGDYAAIGNELHEAIYDALTKAGTLSASALNVNLNTST